MVSGAASEVESEVAAINPSLCGVPPWSTGMPMPIFRGHPQMHDGSMSLAACFLCLMILNTRFETTLDKDGL